MERIDDCISFLLGKAGQQVTRRARALLAPHGVTPAQYAALKALAEQRGMSGAALGQRLVLDSASITGIVDRLEALGLVERRADGGDRRVQMLLVTRKGQALQEALDAAMDRLNAEAEAILGSGARRLSEGLRRLADPGRWRSDV